MNHGGVKAQRVYEPQRHEDTKGKISWKSGFGGRSEEKNMNHGDAKAQRVYEPQRHEDTKGRLTGRG